MNGLSFRNRFMKWFYGIEGPFDEYKRQEIDRIGHNAFIAAIIYMLLSTTVGIFAGLESRQAIWALLFVNFFALEGLLVYVSVAVSRLHLTDMEVTAANYRQVVKRTLWKWAGGSLLATVNFFLLMGGFNAALNQTDFFKAATSADNVQTTIIYGVLFAGAMFFIYWHRIKKIDVDR